MRKHTKIYLDKMGYDVTDFIPCEMCEAKAVDIHHIEARGMGGSKTADTIENLMALCRNCHTTLGDLVQYKEVLKQKHEYHMKQRGYLE
jgi:5-methylcytosine-specific restriction endonuclease McrA